MGGNIGAFGSNGFPRTRQASGTWLPGAGWPKLAAGAAAGIAVLTVVAIVVFSLPPEKTAIQATGTGAAVQGTSADLVSLGAVAVLPSRTASATPSPTPTTPSPSPSVTQAAGTLNAAPDAIHVGTRFSSAVTLTAGGGPVAYSVSLYPKASDRISVTPASGHLDEGQSVSVSVSDHSTDDFQTTLTISPGDEHVFVTAGRG